MTDQAAEANGGDESQEKTIFSEELCKVFHQIQGMISHVDDRVDDVENEIEEIRDLNIADYYNARLAYISGLITSVADNGISELKDGEEKIHIINPFWDEEEEEDYPLKSVEHDALSENEQRNLVDANRFRHNLDTLQEDAFAALRG